MPSITFLQGLHFSDLSKDSLLSTVLKCPVCGSEQPSAFKLDDLKNLDREKTLEQFASWFKVNVVALCVNGHEIRVEVAVHKNGSVIVANPDVEITENMLVRQVG